MLPVLTSPLGSRKAIFSSFSTLYCFKASAKDSALVAPVPFPTAMPLRAADAYLAEAFFDRTRSAQDLGAVRDGGEVAEASSAACDSVPTSGCAVGLSSTYSEAAGCGRGGGIEVVSEDAVFGLAMGIFGRAGIIGTAVRVSFLVCAAGLDGSVVVAVNIGVGVLGAAPTSDGA